MLNFLSFFLIFLNIFSNISAKITPLSFTLDNGLKVVVVENHTSPIVSIQMWYKVGSSYETYGETGLAHFVEHMMFKGTKKYPKGSMEEFVERAGGFLNAATSRDFTYYYFKIHNQHIEKILDMMASNMKDLKFSQKELETEKKVIIEERQMRIENNPFSRFYEIFTTHAYSAVPYHHPIIGWMEDIKATTLETLQKWYDTWYQPNNATLIITGDVDFKKLKPLIKKYFHSIPSKKIPIKRSIKEPPIISTNKLKVILPAKVPMFIMAYRAPCLRPKNLDKTSYGLSAACWLLANGLSSRLEKIIVKEKKLATSINISYQPYTLHETLVVVSGIPYPNISIKKLKKEVFIEIEKIKSEKVSSHELQKIKNQIYAENIFALDDINSLAEEIGFLESIGFSYKEKENYDKQISSLKSDDILKACQQILTKPFIYAELIPENPHKEKL